MLWYVLVGGGAVQRAAWSDTVWVRKDDRGVLPRQGKILDLQRDYLLLERIAGRPEKILSVHIVRIEYRRTPAQERADGLFDARRYADAAAMFATAEREEDREWVRREMVARRCMALRNTGRMVEAAEAFRKLVAADESQRHLGAAPLVWTTRLPTGAMRAWARAHLTDDPPVRLVAASWLLAGPLRSQAAGILQQLELEGSPSLAGWAAFQRQRATSVEWDERAVERYAGRIVKLPESLRAGPAFLVGSAYAREGRPAAALEWLLRVALLYPHEAELAAESLYAAGDAAVSLDRAPVARRLWLLLTDRYPRSAAARRAAARLGQKQE